MKIKNTAFLIAFILAANSVYAGKVGQNQTQNNVPFTNAGPVYSYQVDFVSPTKGNVGSYTVNCQGVVTWTKPTIVAPDAVQKTTLIAPC